MKIKTNIGIISVCLAAMVLYTDRSALHSIHRSISPLIETTMKEYYYGIPVYDKLIVKDRVKKNEFIGDILAKYYVPEKIIRELSALPTHIFDVRKVAPNREYTLICNRDSVIYAEAMIYQPNAIEYVIFNFEDSLSVQMCQRDITYMERGVSGSIKSSLSETIEELGISHELTNKFVDIFAWQVDFNRLQRGDEFKILYDELLVEGRGVAIEKISGIYFRHDNKDYYAYSFDQGQGIEYFDEAGNSLRKAFLRYPIEFTRISSRYSRNRFHPVQKRWKPHLGTDFAAPTGTPIRSAGSGVIEEAQYKNNNGNYVKIKHNGTYSTQYLHMSRIAKGIKRGVSVKQGQVIGYVGSTGLAKGAHLCYRFWKNGVQVDALKVKLPSAFPVQKEKFAEFEKQKLLLRHKLDQIPTTEAGLLASIF